MTGGALFSTASSATSDCIETLRHCELSLVAVQPDNLELRLCQQRCRGLSRRMEMESQ